VPAPFIYRCWAVVGSIILPISVIFVTGKPLSSACRWMSDSFLARYTERLVAGNKRFTHLISGPICRFQRWRKKYIIAAMISNASRKRKMVQLLLVSGVIGELSIASPTLPKLAFAVFASPNFASSVVTSSV
jgi:hypothetical protein